MKKERKKVQKIEKEDHVVEKEARVGNAPGAEKGIEGNSSRETIARTCYSCSVWSQNNFSK